MNKNPYFYTIYLKCVVGTKRTCILSHIKDAHLHHTVSPSQVRCFKRVFLLHKALMVCVTHLSSPVCLSQGLNGNHQPRWTTFRRWHRQKRPNLTRLRSFLTFNTESKSVSVGLDPRSWPVTALLKGLFAHCGL